jgi:hypothetical protein
MRTHFVPVALLAAAVSAVAPTARAQDTAACVDASNQGLTLRKSRKLLDARKVLVGCAVDACGADIKGTCTQRVGEINDALPTIILLAKDGAGNDLAGVKVTVDGAGAPMVLDGRSITLDPGTHLFKLETPGQAPVEKSFVLAEKQKDRREVVTIGAAPLPAPVSVPASTAPTPMPAAPPPEDTGSSWSTQKTLAIVAGGVGVVGLGLGTVFGLMASSKWSSAQSDCGSGCGASAPAQGEKSDATTDATVSTVGFVVGGAGMVGAAVLWFTAPSGRGAPATGTRVKVIPTVGAGNGGVLVSGAF